MSTASLIRPEGVPPVTPEQRTLITRTVAAGATPDELALYLFDCQRQGVHPLDKLLHFTKRAGRYTPITSIDFMRMRAADTGEYAGSDDAVFDGATRGPEFAARVTVHRFVQGQRCPFTATARWAEYCPAPGQDHMWRKMPHTMLAKCAEALALRKGFPRQLSGLYAKEELDQADSPGVEAAPQGGSSYATTAGTAPMPELPPGTVRLERMDSAPTKNPKVVQYRVTLSTGEVVRTINSRIANEVEALIKEGVPVVIEVEETKFGVDLKKVTRYTPPSLPLEGDDAEPEGPPSADDIPF